MAARTPAGILPQSLQWVHWTCWQQVQRAQLECFCIVSPIRFDLSWTGNYAAILLSYFLDPWEGGLLWLYEVIAIIVAHTLQTWINTITIQHLVWRRFSGPLPALSSPSHAKNKCNLLLPICQKRKAKKGKEKREIAQSQCMCYKFQEKQKMISQKNNIWN